MAQQLYCVVLACGKIPSNKKSKNRITAILIKFHLRLKESLMKLIIFDKRILEIVVSFLSYAWYMKLYVW